MPVPGEAYDGAFINHPDTDLADLTLNTSGVRWYTLYYKESYPRLQRIKARWDPRDLFRHALSIRVEGCQSPIDCSSPVDHMPRRCGP